MRSTAYIIPGRWKWLTPLYFNELEKASAFHASGIAAMDASTTAFPLSSENESLYRISVYSVIIFIV